MAEVNDGYKDIESGHQSTIPPEPEIGKGFLKPIPETTTLERIAGVAAAVAVVTALAAIVVEQSVIVIFAGILSAVIGPYAYYQQTLLTDIRTLKETKDALQTEVDRLTAANDTLARNIDSMTETINHLEDIDQALEIITNSQEKSVDAFAKQVEESKKILEQMQSNHKAAVLQNLLTVIFRSDTDKNNIISDSEVADLMKAIRSTTGVVIHEDRFRTAVTGKPVSAVVDVVENLLREDVPEDQRIFELPQ